MLIPFYPHRLLLCKKRPYKAPFQPYASWAGLFFTGLVIILNGFPVFMNGQWDTSKFIAAYGEFFSLLLFFFLSSFSSVLFFFWEGEVKWSSDEILNLLGFSLFFLSFSSSLKKTIKKNNKKTSDPPHLLRLLRRLETLWWGSRPFASPVMVCTDEMGDA